MGTAVRAKQFCQNCASTFTHCLHSEIHFLKGIRAFRDGELLNTHEHPKGSDQTLTVSHSSFVQL